MAKRKKQSSINQYQSGLMASAKNTIGLGILTGAGSGIMGSMGQMVPGSGAVGGSVNAALGLANVGNLASVGMQVARMPGMQTKKKSKKTNSFYSGW